MDNDLIQDTNLDLLQVNAVEVEYSGIAPINVDNQEHTISLDPSALSSKLDTSAFDEWTATHSAGQEYSAGEGIDITDHVISYTGDPGEATPWISGNKIITSADVMQPGEYVQVLSSFDLSGDKNHFITVKGQGYYFPTNQQLKERVGVEDYLPLSSFSSYTASIADNLQNNWNYTNSAYTQSINNYYNKLDASAFSSVSGDFYTNDNPSGFITGVDLSDYYKKNETSSKEEISDALTAIDNTISGLTGEFQEKGDYYSASNPSGFITGVDLSNYYKKNETSSKEEIENAITSVENIINNLSGEYYPLTSNPSGYLTAHQSLDDYQKTADMTAYQPVGDYYSASNPSGFITGVDLTDYVERDELTAYQEKGDYYSASNPSGFITGVDLSNYYEKNETSSKEEISAALTSKLDESAFTAYTATAVQGIEYTGIAPIVVNNEEHIISAQSAVFSLQDPLYFVEDSNTATIVGIHSSATMNSASISGTAQYALTTGGWKEVENTNGIVIFETATPVDMYSSYVHFDDTHSIFDYDHIDLYFTRGTTSGGPCFIDNISLKYMDAATASIMFSHTLQNWEYAGTEWLFCHIGNWIAGNTGDGIKGRSYKRVTYGAMGSTDTTLSAITSNPTGLNAYPNSFYLQKAVGYLK